jgi:hypothetical protein
MGRRVRAPPTFNFSTYRYKKYIWISNLFAFCMALEDISKSTEKLPRLQEVHGGLNLLGPKLGSLFHGSSSTCS